MFIFLHTADWHLGCTQYPLKYQKEALNALIKLAKTNNISYIFCAGDIFDRPHVPQEISNMLLSFLLENPDINFIFSIGNHDYTTKVKNFHSLQYLKILQEKNKLDNVFICEKGIYHFNTSSVNAFSIIVFPDDLFDESFYSSIEQNYKFQINIGLWHGFYEGIQPGQSSLPKATKSKFDKLLKKYKLNYLALGDIHQQIELHPNCFYSGGLFQKTYGCQSGLLIVEIDEKGNTTVTPKSLDIPKKITFVLETKENTSEKEIIAFVKENVEQGHFIRLKFSLSGKAFASLDKEFVKKELEGYVLELKIDNDTTQEQQERKSLKLIKVAKTLEEELQIVIDESTTVLDKGKLLDYCRKYS